MASLRDFLLKGRLGPVELGMRPEQVEQELGPAEDHSVSTRPVQILKFGSVEVAFKTVPGTDDQRSIAMGVYFGIPGRDLPPRIDFEDWNATENTTEEDARRFLAQAGIGVHSRVDGEIRNLILDPGSSMAFDEGLLRSMHYRRADKRGGATADVRLITGGDAETTAKSRTGREHLAPRIGRTHVEYSRLSFVPRILAE